MLPRKTAGVCFAMTLLAGAATVALPASAQTAEPLSSAAAEPAETPPITTGAGRAASSGGGEVTPAQRATNRDILSRLRLSKPSIDGWLKTPSRQQTPRIPKRQ